MEIKKNPPTPLRGVGKLEFRECTFAPAGFRNHLTKIAST
jgi:hypothetical protein